MRFLIIGLGSMGKRRIRNLRALGFSDITGYDAAARQSSEAEKIYGVRTLSRLEEASGFDAAIISTPPDAHDEYIGFAIERGKPAFVELSLLTGELRKLNKIAKSKGILIAPSCTSAFNPHAKIIKKIVQGKRFGDITNFVYYVGQHLADWHPWEKANKFFIARKRTSGCKEILASEMHWIAPLAGLPRKIAKVGGMTAKLRININDTYALSIKFEKAVGAFLIDIVSRFATRNLILNLEKAQVRWDWKDPLVRLYDASAKKWTVIPLSRGKRAAGYDKNIREDIYVEEMRSFVSAVKGLRPFPNDLDREIEILKSVESLDL